MTRKKGITVPKIRKFLYSVAKFLGDVQAIKTGKIERRIANRALGHIIGKGLGYINRRLFYHHSSFIDTKNPDYSSQLELRISREYERLDVPYFI
jgi:hypothetical protein